MNDLSRFVYNSPFNLGKHPEPREDEGCFTKEFHRNGQGCWVPKVWIQEPTITMVNKHEPSEQIRISVCSEVADEFDEINLLVKAKS